MHHKAVLFDLDGTLADTLTDIAAAANEALESVGRPARPTGEYRYLAGQGVDYLVRHALGPEHQAEAEVCKRRYLAAYERRKYDRSAPFDGLPEALDELVQRGITLAVLSNKPDGPTKEMVSRLFGRWPFAAVQGAREGVPLKPDPGAALAIARDLGIPPEAWVYVGDTRADMLTGRAAGMYTAGVIWGFRDEAELRESGAQAIIRHPSELPGLLR